MLKGIYVTPTHTYIWSRFFAEKQFVMLEKGTFLTRRIPFIPFPVSQKQWENSGTAFFRFPPRPTLPAESTFQATLVILVKFRHFFQHFQFHICKKYIFNFTFTRFTFSISHLRIYIFISRVASQWSAGFNWTSPSEINTPY